MTQRINTGGPVRLAYRQVGSGRPVVLLHGTGADAFTWDAVSGWPESWRVLAFDLRGHGRSPWTTSYELPDLADDVIGMLDALDLPHVDLVGHSMGGMVAYLLAARAPERIRRLVLAEPPPPVPAVPPRDEGTRPDRELSYDWDFQAPFSRQRNDPDPSWWTGLDRITAPTLILAGTRGSFPVESVRAMAERIPDCRLEFLDAAHHLHEEQPTAFAAAVTGFLSDRGQAERPADVIG